MSRIKNGVTKGDYRLEAFFVSFSNDTEITNSFTKMDPIMEGRCLGSCRLKRPIGLRALISSTGC